MSTILGLWTEMQGRHRALARTGLAMAALLAACLLAMPFDGRQAGGLSVWVKPAKFAASLCLWAWTMAWLWPALAPAAREGRTARIIVAGTIAFILFEAGWIALRAGLGLPSHFAKDALGGAVYSLMGVAALAGCGLAAAFGVLVARHGNSNWPAALRLGVALGFVVAGVFGALTGATISVLDSPRIGGLAADARTFPPFFWSRSGGDLRVAHFVAIHAMQALPVLAWLSRSRAAVAAGGVALLALTAGTYLQALAGRPLV